MIQMSRVALASMETCCRRSQRTAAPAAALCPRLSLAVQGTAPRRRSRAAAAGQAGLPAVQCAGLPEACGMPPRPGSGRRRPWRSGAPRRNRLRACVSWRAGLPTARRDAPAMRARPPGTMPCVPPVAVLRGLRPPARRARKRAACATGRPARVDASRLVRAVCAPAQLRSFLRRSPAPCGGMRLPPPAAAWPRLAPFRPWRAHAAPTAPLRSPPPPAPPAPAIARPRRAPARQPLIQAVPS